MSAFYHLCFVVQDIQRATEDLTRVLGVTWSRVRTGKLGEWEYSIVFSVEGPPFFEVIQGAAGSPWDAAAGSRFDHIGYWSRDVTTDKQQLAARGAPIEFDSCPYGRSFTYHRLDSIGARVELVDLAAQEGFLGTWAPEAPTMPVLDLDGPTAEP
ncbi:VOC family protein [Amycolatopsis cynarae]|uniref:VOC family protein n=1 Tax=Amycolatopsis cynarae TaxID=2995223 RepID=A0ABY7AY60_9PSEU|nr:VOC family protein [Amycolatopsis sp. HUAS 11-8]WAL64946.1 VOC family protein [Amycolatopsis sp. HUAS 11-8]